METKIYAVFDNKAEAYMAPFTTLNAALALRSFADNLSDPNSIFAKHPHDFCLYEIGTFDDHTGDIQNYIENKNLGLAAEYLPKSSDSQLELIK